MFTSPVCHLFRVPLVRKCHFPRGLSLYCILLVETSLPAGKFFLRFLEMHSNFMHLIESKAKLNYKYSPIFLRVSPCQNLSNLTSAFVYIIQYQKENFHEFSRYAVVFLSGDCFCRSQNNFGPFRFLSCFQVRKLIFS